SVDGTEQGRLACAGRADDHAQLPGRDREVDVAQHGFGRACVGDRDVVEGDHAGAPAVDAGAAASVRSMVAARSWTGGGVANAGMVATSKPSTGSSGSDGHTAGETA